MSTRVESARNLRPAAPTPAEDRPANVVPPLELAGMVGLACMVAIHATELAGKTEEVAYLGAGYVAVIAAALIAMVMLAIGDPRAWRLSALSAGATLIGYVLTRTTGLPASTGDIGNWGESLAVWAMLSELAVVALALGALARTRRSA